MKPTPTAEALDDQPAPALPTAETDRASRIEAVWRRIERTHPKAALERIEGAVAWAVGRPTHFPASPLHRPEAYFVPGLRDAPWHDRAFPQLRILERHADAIRTEMLGQLGRGDGFRPYGDPTGETGFQAAKFRLDASDRSWLVYRFFWGDRPVAENAARCPSTTAALKEAFDGGPYRSAYSVLRPGATVHPHCGLTNAMLTFHLALVVPEGCAIQVGGETRTWTEGEAFAFDDSYEHEAWHRGTETRVVLLGGFWHYDLTEIEIAAMDALLRAVVPGT